MTDLVKEHCETCAPGTPALTPAESDALRAELDESWSIRDGDHLHRRLEFGNFSAAFAMATGVALLCEQQGHHADLGVGWGYLEIGLTTHAAGGLTRNDFILAAKIDRIAR